MVVGGVSKQCVRNDSFCKTKLANFSYYGISAIYLVIKMNKSIILARNPKLFVFSYCSIHFIPPRGAVNF